LSWFDKHRPVFQELLRHRIGVAQAENARLFDLLGGIFPLQLHSFDSGSEHNGWIVPDAWHVLKAEIRRGGKVLFDGLVHPMAVIGNSVAFSGSIGKAELDKHVFFSRAQPDAYAFHCMNNYRPWAKEWGFCIPLAEYQTWEDGNYEIELVTEFSAGKMLVAEAVLPGESSETIVFNAHTCHPCQFEDGFSGVALILELFDELQKQDRRRYTYKAILAPEHLGTVFYLANLKPEERARLKAAVFTEMIGLKTSLTVQNSFTGHHVIDRIAGRIARDIEPEARIGEFRTILGNDETVWEAPGYEIPCISLSRCSRSPHYYDEYHTSNDLIERSDMAQRSKAFDLLRRMVGTFENDAIITRRFEGLIALSNPRYGLYVERPEPTVDKKLSGEQLTLGALQDRIVRYFNGNFSISELAEKFSLSFETMNGYVRSFEAKGLVDLEAVPSLDWYARRKEAYPA
jgi:aminopeptidase-like protein